MELECSEHSDKFVPDLVAMISVSCRGNDTEVEVVVYTTSLPLTTKELLWRIKQTLPHPWDHWTRRISQRGDGLVTFDQSLGLH